ncbi:hypothetical protein HO133_007323 [Letharia lupina]|uniref:tRNA-splicing endonuclease subunit Sen34 n=1 Tax=Letharia lupina TaxID=560253 RepID=A0A8H6FIN4_9LECA|nr:uncharacterized protein HO133_007323 [Letharia lupina]KAF6229207.1 hypothetical protein HO133_007323 [Letharia lupina]
MTAPVAPSLPFPVFQVSQKVEHYLLYDINIITWLRKNHNILGVLVGTLPQIPQQNVFLGLPLELQPEEARLLVERSLAYIVNDLDWHMQDLASNVVEQKEAIRADLREQGARVAKDFESNKKSRTQKALKRIQAKSGSTVGQRSIPSPALEEAEDTSEETLFGEPLTRETTVTPSPEPRQAAGPEFKPWTVTPTTSYPLISPPANIDSPDLPKVNPSSYALFKHLHSLGYFLSPGIRFGCQFSVYPGDPLRFHSHFLTMSADWDEEIDLLDLVGGGRLGTGVKKGWLVGGVEQKGEEGEGGKDSGEAAKRGTDDGARVRTFCIEWGGM